MVFYLALERSNSAGLVEGGCVMSNLMRRIAGAPITWGIDPSPGWGHLISPDRYMTELTSCGLTATELGPDGFLPSDPDRLADYLEQYDAEIIGGFVPAVLYRPDRAAEALGYVERAAGQLASTGSEVIVLGPAADQIGYDRSVDLDEDEWAVFFENLTRFDVIATDNGLVTAVHPHWGMAVERQGHLDRVLESSETGLCLDTGHLQLAGVDPVELARSAGKRVVHVHLKDLDEGLAEGVRTHEVPFREAVIAGMFRPLGAGVVDIAGLISILEGSGFTGWYVLEQDTSLDEEPESGEGPLADVEESMRFLEGVASSLEE